MDQWVKETTRYRGDDEPSQLDLVFTKKPEVEPGIDYLCPVGKSDHVLMEINIQEEELHKCNEEYKKERRNCGTPCQSEVSDTRVEIELSHASDRATQGLS